MKAIRFSIPNSIFLAVFLTISWAHAAVALPNQGSNQIDSRSIEEYFGVVQTKIKANWKPPKIKVVASPLVRFRILPNGQLMDVRIYRSANNQDIDTSILAAVKNAAPFPEITIPPYNKDGLLAEMNFSCNEGRMSDETNKLIAKANRCVDSGNWQFAITLLTEGLAKDPDNARLKKYLSSLYSNQANVIAAVEPRSAKVIELAKMAYSLDPTNEEAIRHLPAQWSALNPSGYGFSVQFLSKCKHSNLSSQVGALDSWTANSDGCFYQVGAAKFDDISQRAVTTETGLDSAFRGFVSEYFEHLMPRVAGEMTPQQLVQEYNLDGHPAKVYSFHIQRDNPRAVLYGKSIFCITGHFAYVFTALDQPGKADSSIVFFNSIKIND